MDLGLHRALPVVGFGLNILLLVVALVADRRDPRNRAFAGFTAALAAWNFGVIGLRSAPDPASALRWEWLIHVAIAVVPVLFAEYVRAFLGWRHRSPLLAAAYVLAAIFIAITPTRSLMVGVQETVWGYAPVPGAAYGLFLVYFYGYLVGGAVALAGEGGGVGTAVRALIAVGALAAGLPVLRKLEALLERVMFHREHGVRDALLELARELGTVTHVRGVGSVLTRGLVVKVPLRSAGLYVPEPGDRRFQCLARYVAEDDDVQSPPDAIDDALVEWLAARREAFIAEDEMLHAGDGPAVAEAGWQLSAAHLALAVPIVEDDALSAVVLLGG